MEDTYSNTRVSGLCQNLEHLPTHQILSLIYLQSSGLAERFVQTVKMTLIKAMAAHKDPHIALLVYRATPLSPAVCHHQQSCHNLRKYHRTLLPARALAQRKREERNREVMMQSMQLRQNNPKATTTQSYKASNQIIQSTYN